MRRMLVEKALEKAEKYEKQGNKKEAEKWLNYAEKVEAVYNKYQNKKG